MIDRMFFICYTNDRYEFYQKKSGETADFIFMEIPFYV